MRLPTLTAATVLAIVTCIGIVHNAEGAENREVNQHPLEMLETSVDPVTLCLVHVISLFLNVDEEVNLVCHRVIIDTNYLCKRPVIVFEAGLTASVIILRTLALPIFVNMDEPRCKKLPQNPASPVNGLPDGFELDTDSELDNLYEDDGEEDDKVLGAGLNNDESHADISLAKHHRHHRHRKGGHQHGIHPHHRLRGGRRHRHPRGPGHPWIGLYVNTLCSFLDATENFPLGPEASKLLKISIGTNLTAYFDNSVDSAGSTAALLANTLPQIVDVIKASAIALMLLQPTIDKISDGLIAGNDKGLTDLLKFIVDSRVGVAGALMPALLKAVLDVIKPIMNIIKDYPKTQT
ncbi:hypothetical protein CPC16_001279 [Podila verticillata]|nr:hypothetical protein CPC16_001279 [Podila verticillata]